MSQSGTATVTDGNAAVSACQTGRPDAVVLDMMLPNWFLQFPHEEDIYEFAAEECGAVVAANSTVLTECLPIPGLRLAALG